MKLWSRTVTKGVPLWGKDSEIVLEMIESQEKSVMSASLGLTIKVWRTDWKGCGQRSDRV